MFGWCVYSSSQGHTLCLTHRQGKIVQKLLDMSKKIAKTVHFSFVCLSNCLTFSFDLTLFLQDYPDTNGNESLTEENRWVT